jgi:hypothetical protein
MVIRLYATPLSERTSDEAAGQVGSQVRQAGLLDTGGTNVENVATENVDFRKRGRIQVGPTMSAKYASELNSLSESAYTSLPLYDSTGALGEKRGYYEVARIDVSPAQESRQEAYTYDVSLTLAGTREDSRRAVSTNPEAIATNLATGSPAPIGVPAEAITPRWYDEDTGTEDATPTDTVTAEYGDVELYDYTEATADAPDLVYDLPFEREGPVDVRVYDDRDTDKFTSTVSGGQANVWPHAFHTGWQFDGDAVVDNGRVRLRLGNDVTAEEYNTGTDAWDSVALTSGDLSLQAWSLERIGPAAVRVRLVATDTSNGSTRTASVRVQRGLDGVLLRQPRDDVLSPKYESWLGPIASDASDDPQPEQTLRDRSDLA